MILSQVFTLITAACSHIKGLVHFSEENQQIALFAQDLKFQPQISADENGL